MAAIVYNPNGKNIKLANKAWLDASGAVNTASQTLAATQIVVVRHMQAAVRNKELTPEHTEKFFANRAKMLLDQAKRSSLDVLPLKDYMPGQSKRSEFKLILEFANTNYCERFMNDAGKIGVTFSFMYPMISWCIGKSGEYKDHNTGPDKARMVKKLNALRKATNNNSGTARVTYADAQLAAIIDSLTEYKASFGDSDDYVSNALKSLKSEKGNAVEHAKAQKEKAKKARAKAAKKGGK